jgi:hypothetical protein
VLPFSNARAGLGSRRTRNIIRDAALPSTIGGEELVGFRASPRANEGIMATTRDRQIIETPTEARQAERGPSVLALLTVSTGLAVLILGVLWFVFFRT